MTSVNAANMLAGLPPAFRDALIESYQEIGRNYFEHRWGPSELDGGKFCEAAYSIVHGMISGSFGVMPTKPKDMVRACRDLEGRPANSTLVGDRSLRVLIPRILLGIYEIRNNRNVGHIGGEVDPNFMDATAVYSMSSWVLAELVRILHSIPTKEAQEIVNELVEKRHPLVWEVEDIRRVLDPGMKKSDQALVLLYSKPGWVGEKDLFGWVEYSKASMFRVHILAPHHAARLIEYDQKAERARITPLGSVEVERRLLKVGAKLQ
jgi:hypothetical protein